MPYSFQTGHRYTRRDIYRIIGLPEDTHGGNWDTGYARHGNAWFIFCNVGTSGRTGHNYANQWRGNRLEWYGKTNSQLRHRSIQSILSVNSDIYIFWRENNQQPFIFAGIGNVEEVEDIIPVKIIWTFATEIFPIHVHHLRPLSEIGEEYEVNPVEDLRPVCPNCHAMIHRRSPPLTIEEIKTLLKSATSYKI